MKYLESISKILSRKTLLSPKIKNSAQVCWAADLILKKMIDVKIKTISFNRSILKVRVDSNAVANEIKLKEKTIIKAIQKELQPCLPVGRAQKVKIEKIRTAVR